MRGTAGSDTLNAQASYPASRGGKWSGIVVPYSPNLR